MEKIRHWAACMERHASVTVSPSIHPNHCILFIALLAICLRSTQMSLVRSVIRTTLCVFVPSHAGSYCFHTQVRSTGQSASQYNLESILVRSIISIMQSVDDVSLLAE